MDIYNLESFSDRKGIMEQTDKELDIEVRNNIYVALEEKVKEKIVQWSDNPRSYTYEHMSN
jgi:hypothetical protein